MNIKLIVAYAGTRYLGWQKTKMGPSIEETLELALQTILREEVSLQAASRTDAGVHAEGQVVNFKTEKQLDLSRLQRSLKGLLPKDIAILSATCVDENFHPTLQCVGKEYRYHICAGNIQLPFHRELSWHFRSPLDLNAMHCAAQILLGTHDFSTFSNERIAPEEAIRTLKQIVIEELADERLRIAIVGDNFLYKMVRNIVGTLAYIGCGKLPPDNLAQILRSRSRPQAGMTAPAHGLSLFQVFY